MTTPPDHDTSHALTSPTSAPGLDAQDEALHPLLRHALAQRQTHGVARVWAGLKIVWGSIQLIYRTPGMWKLVIWPTLINLALFIAGVTFVWTHKRGWFELIWAHPIDDLAQLAWWLVYAIFSATLTGVVYTSTVLLGGIVASPFNDLISQRTERELLGERYVEPPPGAMLQDMLRSVWSSTIMVLTYGACMLPVLCINIVPGVGQAAYTIIAFTISAYFVALEYCDVLLQRRHLKLKEKFRLVWRERSLTMGFGLGTSLTLALPLLNFLCIPIAVVGGTVTGLALAQWREDEPLVLEANTPSNKALS